MRLGVAQGEKRVSLGLCVPNPDGFGMDTKIPVKRLGEGEREIYVEKKERFFPLVEKEPLYLCGILRGRLGYCQGILGIILPEQDPPDSDPNP